MTFIAFIGMYCVNIPPKSLHKFVYEILIFLKIFTHIAKERKYGKGNQRIGCGGTLPRP